MAFRWTPHILVMKRGVRLSWLIPKVRFAEGSWYWGNLTLARVNLLMIE
jgi:hypothetical protein